MKAPFVAIRRAVIVGYCLLALFVLVPRARAQDSEFGPVVRAYLGYLRNEQEVVDDRASRREVRDRKSVV